MNIVLIGYRGSGKSTVGRLLAEALWMTFVDVDERIAQLAGTGVGEVYLRLGDGEFTQVEGMVIESVAGEDERVISVGGQALRQPRNIELLKADGRGRLIWLQVEPPELVRRLASRDKPSPNFEDTLEEVERLLAERAPIYESAADITLDITHLTPQRAVAQIAKVI
jgi:shikimate kinase